MADIIERFVKAVENAQKEISGNENSNFLAWDHCYKAFHDARKESKPDYDYLSLQLTAYLACWGMYRGSSFLSETDYKVHTGASRIIMEPEYDVLLGINYNRIKEGRSQTLLKSLYDELKDYYHNIRERVYQKKNETEPASDVSDTLITKILLGTLACVPAYDEYLTNAIKNHEIVKTKTYSMESVLDLAEFYGENHEKLDELRDKIDVFGLPYPQMKLLDLGFWQIGKEDLKK